MQFDRESGYRDGALDVCHNGTYCGTKLERVRESADVTGFLSDGNLERDMSRASVENAFQGVRVKR